MKRRFVILLLLLIGTAGSCGCAAMGIAALGVGASAGLSYTLDSIVYRTFMASEEQLRAATLRTLKRMDMPVNENQSTESGRRIAAVAGDRTVEIELDRLTTRTSRMRVNVRQGWFFKDRATATEIILQTKRALDEQPMLVRKDAAAKGAVRAKK